MGLSTTRSARAWWCLIPQAASQQLAYEFAVFEESGIGINRSNIDVPYDFTSYQFLLCEMMIGGALFAILGLYLDNVMPTAVGGRKHPCFCFLPRSYTCFRSKKDGPHDTDDDDSNDTMDVSDVDDEKTTGFITRDQSADIEIKNMAPENYESVPAEIARLEALGKILRIENLQKIYENGFKAVKGLNLRMYQN